MMPQRSTEDRCPQGSVICDGTAPKACNRSLLVVLISFSLRLRLLAKQGGAAMLRRLIVEQTSINRVRSIHDPGAPSG